MCISLKKIQKNKYLSRNLGQKRSILFIRGKKGEEMTETGEVKLLNNDIIFKNTFNSTEFLKRLLEETLDIKVNELYSANTEMPVEYLKEKGKILDLIVCTDKGTINVEVNNEYKEDMYVRNFLYFCKLISSHLTKNNRNYNNAIAHIQLNITWNLKSYFKNIDVSKRKKVEFYVTDTKTGTKVFEEIFKIVNINMDYYKNLWYSKDTKRERPFLLLLAASNIKEMEEISEGDEIMEKIVKRVEKLNYDPKIATEIAKQIAIENESEIWANTMYSRGMEKGTKQNQLAIVKNMLKKNTDINFISEVTGLSLKEIENLK